MVIPANNFTLGNVIRIAAEFEQNSTLLNPGTVTLIIEENDSTSFTSIVTPSTLFANSTTGKFSFDYDAATAGLVEYRWKSSNPQGATEAWFTIDRSRVGTP